MTLVERRVGERVAVIMGAHEAEDGSVHIVTCGRGEYLGELTWSEAVAIDAEVPAPCGVLGDAMVAQNAPNPLIKMDDGGYAWGCEVLWGPVDQIEGHVMTAKAKGAIEVRSTMAEQRALYAAQAKQ